MTILGWVQ